MAFSDENLKRFKDGVYGKRPIGISDTDFKALLDRLEAAEAVCERLGVEPDLRNMDWFIPTNKLFKEWCKACGR